MSIAGIFKNAIKSAVGSADFTEIYKAVGVTSYVIECDVACTGNTGVQVSVRVQKESGIAAYVVKLAPVPVGSAIQVINGQKLVLEPGDSLEVKCETTDQVVDVIVSLVENVNI